MSETLYLLKVPLMMDRLVAIARRRNIPTHDFDEGYLIHSIFKELWQEIAPSPFVIRGRSRFMDVWGYSAGSARQLTERAQTFGDPALVEAIDGCDAIAGREMPLFKQGQRVGFLLRATPIVRLAKARAGHRSGSEIDAFLAKCFEVGPEVVVSREQVYRDWILKRFEDPRCGAKVESVALAGIARERLMRRTQGAQRASRRIERPDVRFEGNLVVSDGELFRDFLGHGVGRHRAFGFGALMIVPPGTQHAE